MECHTLPVDLKPQTWSDEGMNRLDQLATLLRFPSISAQKEHARDVSDCADWLVDKLSGMGLEAKACKTPLHPIVLARSPREEGKPTVLIYGHYDVQPVDPVELWESDPFEPEVRGGKIYARGATDNKGQLFAHILGVQLGTGPFDHGPVTVAAHDDGNFFHRKRSFLRLRVFSA